MLHYIFQYICWHKCIITSDIYMYVFLDLSITKLKPSYTWNKNPHNVYSPKQLITRQSSQQKKCSLRDRINKVQPPRAPLGELRARNDTTAARYAPIKATRKLRPQRSGGCVCCHSRCVNECWEVRTVTQLKIIPFTPTSGFHCERFTNCRTFKVRPCFAVICLYCSLYKFKWNLLGIRFVNWTIEYTTRLSVLNKNPQHQLYFFLVNLKMFEKWCIQLKWDTFLSHRGGLWYQSCVII